MKSWNIIGYIKNVTHFYTVNRNTWCINIGFYSFAYIYKISDT